MVARGEGPADRLDQLAGEEAALVQSGGRGEQHRELRAGHSGDEPAAAVRLDMALDPPRRRLQHRVARRPAEGGVDRVVAVDREQQDDRHGPVLQLLAEPGPGRAAVAQAGHRIPPARQPLRRGDGLGAADDPARGMDLHMVGDPPLPRLAAMREGGRLTGVEQPVDGVAGGAAPVGIELAEQLHQADPPAVILAEPCLAGERRRELDAARAGLPAPGGTIPLLAAPNVAAGALGMAAGEKQSVEQLRLGERAHEEVGGAMLMEGVQRLRVLARDQDEQGRRIGLDRVGDRAHRSQPLVERAARVDQGDRGARSDEPRLHIVGPARGDRLPAGALGEPGQLVAVTERQNEERRPHRAGLQCGGADANRPAGRIPPWYIDGGMC